MESLKVVVERFAIYSGTKLIGVSELEHLDASMGIRMGRFYPELGYKALEPFYQELSNVSFEESQAAGEPDKRQALQARREQLQGQATTIDLHVETGNGQLIPTVWIHITDFSADLGEDGREVTICVDTHSTYEQFFT